MVCPAINFNPSRCLLRCINYISRVKKVHLSFFLVCYLAIQASAQIGGQNIYRFLNLPNSSRVLALGGSAISQRDDDVSMAYQNPGLLNSKMDNRLSLSFSDYFAGINYGYAAYGFNAGKLGTMHAGIQYVDYGTFDRADHTGEITGTFTAGEYCLTTGIGRQIDSLFIVGLNVKAIFSNLEQYNSFGMAVDFGASYLSRSKLFEMGLVLKNIGYQFNTYTADNRENLPLELQFGMSARLKHLPLRFSFVGHNLQQPDISFRDASFPEQEIDPLTGDTIFNKISLANKIFRHAIFGAELNISKALSLRVGYNYQRRQEMKVATRLGTVGFSWGIGVKIYKFGLAYARSAYHLAGSPNQITVSARLSEFYRKN